MAGGDTGNVLKRNGFWKTLRYLHYRNALTA